MRTFESGATRDSEDNKLDYEGFLNPFVLRRFAEYMHEHRLQADGSLRDSDNWQNGMPQPVYMKSMARHFMCVWQMHRDGYNFGDEMEDALCALLFNVMGMLYEVIQAGDTRFEMSPDRRVVKKC